jgi:hypothetical protein
MSISPSQWVEFGGIAMILITVTGQVWLVRHGDPQVKAGLDLATRASDQAARIAAMLDQRFQQSQATLQSLIDKI